jgi:hypothetical protein
VNVWAENGPKTAETRPDSDERDRILIRVRLAYAACVVKPGEIEPFLAKWAKFPRNG